ncbi:roundabout homolog 3 isoform X5 [Lepidochelys kempii]|uniref:roundabout homolog 3 isoform X5 n=1 Tax=Lepidochelys kempii TaxID=8472 RepID=UPI003C6F3FCE
MWPWRDRAMRRRRRLLLLRSLLCLMPALVGPTFGSRPRLEDFSPRIVEHPSDLIVSKGEPATLNCKAEGRPTPIIEWYKDGERVETDKEDPRSHRMLLPSGSLFFLRIVHGRRSKPDEGVYVCVARNYLGEAVSRNASLEVAILRDDFRQAPSDVVVAAGEPAVMECIPPRGHPEPTISWKKNSIRISDKDERITIRGGKLMMSNTRKSDAGMYVCVATNMVGERDSEPAELVVFERPTFIRRPINQVVLAEDSVDFHCEVQGDPVPTSRWRKEEGELPRGRADIQSDSTLRISRVSAEDEGTYTCVAENSVGKSEASGSLSVHDPAVSQPAPSAYGPLLRVPEWRDDHHGGADSRFGVLHVPGHQRGGEHPGQSPAGGGGCDIRPHPANHPPRARESDAGRGCYSPAAMSCDREPATQRPVAERWAAGCGQGPQGQPVRQRDSADHKHAETGADLQVQLSEPGHLPGPPSAPLVTDVTKNSVTLVWKPSPQRGGTAVTTYIIEAFSQSSGSTWQTVADNVQVEKHTVSGLNPNTIYLFLIRAANAYGLSDPSPVSEPVRTQDVSPTRQGVDHRQVQRELGQVVVQLQEPVILTSTTIQASWTVNRQAQFLQGYRVLYRPRGSTWLVQDVPAPAQRSTVLVDLRKGQEYEVKLRPYFDEFQGVDSEVLVVRTPEEAPSAPPQAVSVVTVGNSTSISVSWEPPPVGEQNGIIQDYRIWCLGNESRFHINSSVEGTVLSAVLQGLVPGVLYRTEVAAVTSAGVGVRSAPVPIQIKPALDQGSVPISSGENVSLAEQITDVVKQPAFIAGIGGACWVILMCFSLWIYWRRKKRKELSHYTASFAYTPAVSFPHAEGPAHGNSRPGMLAMATSASNYPWLADSWPAPNLLLNGNAKEPGTSCCTGIHDATERYYNEAGISNYLAQTEKFGAGASDGPIYSTIDPASDEMRTFNGAFSQHTTPYASTPLVPYGVPSLPSPDAEESPRSPQPGPSGSQYALPERSRAEQVVKIGKAKSMGKPVKTPSLNWTELLPPPPPASELSQYVEEEEEEEEEEELAASAEAEEWCPPLPERTYLMENVQEEQCPLPPPRGDISSPAHSYGQQSTATLTPSPRDEMRAAEDIPRLHHFEIPHLPRRLPNGSGALPRAPSPPLTQSDPNLNALTEGADGHTPRHGHRRNLSQTPAHSAENINSRSPGKACPAPGDASLPPAQKTRTKKKPKSSHYRREKKQGDLPPPPLPPPSEDPGASAQPPAPPPACSASSLERDVLGAHATERRAGHRTVLGQHQQRDVEEIVPYSRPTFLSRGQVSSNCSTTGSSSSRGSTGSRGHGSGRSRTAGDRSEVSQGA